jgi:hypothetical protein
VIRALAPYAKAVVAALGAGLTAAAGFWGTDSTLGKFIVIALAVVTAVGVYAVPNWARPAESP